MIKVMVVDDHELVRTGISRILNDAPGIRVVGEAASGEEALEVVRLKAPDRKSTRLNSSHVALSRMPSSA